MAEIVLTAELRQETGKHAKYARSKDMIPGVYYSRGESNMNIQVATASLDKLVFTSETHVIDLRLTDASSLKCILRDVQFDPVSDRPIHFDLQGLRENEKLTVEIPIVLTGGIAAGVREGGMLQHIIHRLKVSCLPKDMPERIEVNVAGLAMNQSIHVSDLSVPNVTVLESPDTTVVLVLPPHIAKEAAPAEVVEEQAKEPEVVGKGKKAEEGGRGRREGEREGKGARVRGLHRPCGRLASSRLDPPAETRKGSPPLLIWLFPPSRIFANMIVRSPPHLRRKCP